MDDRFLTLILENVKKKQKKIRKIAIIPRPRAYFFIVFLKYPPIVISQCYSVGLFLIFMYLFTLTDFQRF